MVEIISTNFVLIFKQLFMKATEKLYFDNRNMRDKGYVGPFVIETDSKNGIDRESALRVMGSILANDREKYESDIEKYERLLSYSKDMVGIISIREEELRKEIL